MSYSIRAIRIRPILVQLTQYPLDDQRVKKFTFDLNDLKKILHFLFKKNRYSVETAALACLATSSNSQNRVAALLLGRHFVCGTWRRFVSVLEHGRRVRK